MFITTPILSMIKLRPNIKREAIRAEELWRDYFEEKLYPTWKEEKILIESEGDKNNPLMGEELETVIGAIKTGKSPSQNKITEGNIKKQSNFDTKTI